MRDVSTQNPADNLQLFIPVSLAGELKSNGFYDPVKYRYWGYPKKARNFQEERPQSPKISTAINARTPANGSIRAAQGRSGPSETSPKVVAKGATKRERELIAEWDDSYDNLPARHLRPRYLCVLMDSTPNDAKVEDCIIEEHPDRDARTSNRPVSYTGFNKVLVKQWVLDFPERPLEYIVVSYTREHFQTADEGSLDRWVECGKLTADERDERLRMRGDECENLFRLAEKAARDAGVPAFYIDFVCMDKATFQQDIHRISDVVRGAHSLVIALNIPVNNRVKIGQRDKKATSTDRDWLRAWGARMWTVPEILLCSTEHRIKVYSHGDLERPKEYPKRNFAVEAYQDSKLVRQLIDHYEGSLILTPLELVTIGLECLQSRLDGMLANGYSQWSAGDMSYALMALMRRRPEVNEHDSAFEAFANLSLANDSNKLLERLICLLPPDINGPWHNMEDAWRVKLWDIDPRCQVAGVAENQTVILDGAYGATIQWHSLAPVAFIKRTTITRTFFKYSMRFSPVFFTIAVILLASGAALQRVQSGGGTINVKAGTFTPSRPLNDYLIAGIVIFLFTMIIVLTSPYILLTSYKGKLWSTQAEFFGIEGEADIKQVEKYLFGFCHNRLGWSTNGSLLSKHKTNENGECMPDDPDAGVVRSSQRLFTLIDTYTMTATLFTAERPPTTVMMCGSEGGMQRAVLCSYEWHTQTFRRETVLRMKTMVLDRMFHVDEFRFSL